MLTWSTSMPRSARSSSTSRYDRPNRRYQRTASVITSGGNRYPAKAELGAGRGRRRGRDLMVGVSLMRVLGARCNSAREAVDRFTFDARWRYACGVGGWDEGITGFVHTVLVDMRE